MAEEQKILGQSVPVATTLTDTYVAVAKAVCSSITICNQENADTLFRVSVAKNGAGDDPKQYVYYDLPIFAHDTFIATVGITLGVGDIVRCYSANGQCSFNLFGVEIT